MENIKMIGGFMSFKRNLYKQLLLVVVSALLLVGLTACGGALVLNDGEYSAKSESDERGGYVEVFVTVKDGEVSACSMVMYTKEGNVKDENYAKEAGEPYYSTGQAAIKAASGYPDLLVEIGDIEEMDAISGATESFKSFKNAVEKIFKEAGVE